MERRCDNCEFMFPPNRPGGVFYILDESGNRMTLRFGSERADAVELAGVDIRELEPIGKLGYLSDCVCKECLKQFTVDLDRDAKQCPSCQSVQVISARGAIGASCPQCTTGIVREFEPDTA